jgi:hypothetical protein
MMLAYGAIVREICRCIKERKKMIGGTMAMTETFFPIDDRHES